MNLKDLIFNVLVLIALGVMMGAVTHHHSRSCDHGQDVEDSREGTAARLASPSLAHP